MYASREELDDAITHLIPRKPFPQYVDETVFLEVKNLLSQHPDKVFSVWAHENPRLFVLLRMLGCDDDALYQKLDSESISDHWIPLGSTTLGQLSSFTNIPAQDWRRAQLHVLSQPEQMSEQKLLSPVHVHRHIQDGNAHFEEIAKIGKGGSAEVTRVRHKLSGREFACKRIQRASGVKLQRKKLVEFVAELTVLKRVNHHHLVSFVASFTDLASFSLILNPVAKDVLKSMLERHARDQPLPKSDVSTLRRAFGCLATALAYLHEEKNIRHKDIKPGNVLLSDGKVLLCDFGISRDWSTAENSITDDEVLKLTPRYCAPEVFGHEPRNTRSDVWSLGCVFLEMITVVKGYPIEELNSFLLKTSDEQSSRGLWCAPDAMTAWLEEIRSEQNDSADDVPLGWITTMIRSERDERIAASKLVKMISKATSELESPNLYIGSCCTRNDSVADVGHVGGPTLHDPRLAGLGIHTTPTIASNSHRASEDRSISLWTQGANPRDDTESDSVRMDTPQSQRQLQHIASRTDSQWTASLSSPPRADSESASSSRFRARSPVPPPAPFEVKCGCAAQQGERHIFNVRYISGSVPFDPDVPTIQTCAKCEVGEDRVQVYERVRSRAEEGNSPGMPMLWWCTRRLVISYLSGEPKMRHCSSFWLPLADIQFKLTRTTVTLQWSDCNQMTERMSGNYTTYYDWIYNPKSTNNSVTIAFNTLNDAQAFIDIIRFPYEDAETTSHGRHIVVSDDTELNIFDMGRSGVRNYRAATLTIVENYLATSKLFIQWPEADLDIRIIRGSYGDRSAATTGYEMIVEMKNVTTPIYHSDTRGEPAADYARVARFSQARQLKTSLAVAFQLGLKHGLPKPPPGVTDTLQSLTGWTLSYFAIVTQVRSKQKFLRWKRYGRADILLWEKEVDDNATGIKRRGAQITFRLHEADVPWISGSITDAGTISTSTGNEATISIANKAKGSLLDVTKMLAIASETMKRPGAGHSRQASDAHKGMFDLDLTFENEHYRLEFVKLFEKFRVAAASAAPLSPTATSADYVRRLNSLASNEVHMSPPMR